MSHSTKLPGGTYCSTRTGEMKAWKASVNRRLRRKVRQQLREEDYDTPFPVPDEIAGLWDSPGDGKWFLTEQDIAVLPAEWVRKITSK